MPATVSHALSMTTPDDPAYENRPSHWNQTHALTFNVLATEISALFSNKNGVSFGLDGTNITGSIAAGGAPGSISAGTTNFALGEVVFSNSNGISFGLDGATVTAQHNALTSQSNQNVTAGNGGFAFQTLSFSNANGVSFGTSAGSAITASHNALTSQSNQAVSGQNGSSTFQTLSFGNANGISFGTDAAGFTASHNGITSQSNQVLSMYAVGNTTQSSSGTENASTLEFRGEGVASVGVSNGSVVISVPAGGGGITNINVSAGTTSQNLSNLVFSNSNGVSFGLDGSTITANARHTLSTYFIGDPSISVISTIGAASATIFPAQIDVQVTGTRFDVMFSQTVNTAANASTAGVNYSMTVVCLTKDAQTLNSVSSVTRTAGATWSSNNTSNVTGGFYGTVPLNVNITPGIYWFAVQMSTAATGNTLTGAATTSLGNTVSIMGILPGAFQVMTLREINQGTNATQPFYSAMGLYSGTTNMSAISVSAISGAGASYQRAAIAARILG